MSLASILWAIIGGAIIGGLARLMMPGRQSIPIWLTVVVGIVGMVVGDWLASLIGVKETGGIDWIRHALQLLVGVAGVAGVVALTGRGKTS